MLLLLLFYAGIYNKYLKMSYSFFIEINS